MREEKREVESISMATKTIGLYEGQFFCRTAKAWEIWQENPLRRVYRISTDRVFWITEKTNPIVHIPA